MEDLRYIKIREETQIESDTSSSIYAFSGFGRSTESAEKKAEIQGLGQIRETILSRLILLEEQAKAGADVGKALSVTEQELKRLEMEARKRRAELSMKLSDTGNRTNERIRALFSLKTTTYKPKSQGFKIKKPKLLIAKRSKITTKPIKNILAISKLTKSNFSPIKSIGRITSFERLKSFGAKTSLLGFNA